MSLSFEGLQLKKAHRRIHDAGLVVDTQGNVSVRVRDAMLIKPSGETCAQVSEFANIHLETGALTGGFVPSTDAVSHRYVYNVLPDINAIVHTHSNYATAWAIYGRPIACCSTAMADEFGGDIAITNYCEIGGEDIGAEIVRLYRIRPRCAVLVAAHGVFTFAETLAGAVKAAILVEDCAKTMWLANQLGGLKRLSEAEIRANHKRYTERYGQ